MLVSGVTSIKDMGPGLVGGKDYLSILDSQPKATLKKIVNTFRT